MSVTEFIGERVHQRLWRERIPQRTVAARLGISQSALSRKLHGERSWSIEDLMAIVELLGGDLADYLPERASWPEWCAVRDSNPEPADYAGVASRLYLVGYAA